VNDEAALWRMLDCITLADSDACALNSVNSVNNNNNNNTLCTRDEDADASMIALSRTWLTYAAMRRSPQVRRASQCRRKFRRIDK
jgi:hypothetical protein